MSKAHQELEGPARCTSCHVGGGGTRKFRCTTCHIEIAQRLAGNRGLHPSLVGGSHSDNACIKCHSEHNGRAFVPILWDVDVNQFDHRRAGYALEGGHARLECRRCHAPEHITPEARKGIRVRDLRRTFLGLKRECLTCHQDHHHGQLGTDCAKCHTFAKWKDVARFDHSTAKFPLTGAHSTTPCAKCHKEESAGDGGKPRIRYTGIAFARCQDCHQDPHKATLSANCASCHNDANWKSLRNVGQSFDHSKTKYPLIGKHLEISCAKCHHGANFKVPVPHELCKTCHQDVHSGQFISRSDQGECASCHQVEGWKPSTFNVASHGSSAYPLLGRHSTVACEKCHRQAGKATLYRVKYGLCLDCHVDAHKGQFAAAPHNNRCEDCHSVARFRPANFALARHGETRFPLEGGHTAISCGECHKPLPDGRNLAAYHFTDITCEACHFDPHKGQFVERMGVASPKGRTPGNPKGSSGCEACHMVRTWHDVPAFDHSTTRFSLTGAHKGVPCEQCHRATTASAGLQRVVFRDTPRECAECHEDVHLRQFRSLTGEDRNCGACHETGLWRPARFNHDKARFKLDGAHKDVACSGCHKTRKEIGGRLILFYAPTSKECSDCHGSTVAN